MTMYALPDSLGRGIKSINPSQGFKERPFRIQLHPQTVAPGIKKMCEYVESDINSSTLSSKWLLGLSNETLERGSKYIALGLWNQTLEQVLVHYSITLLNYFGLSVSYPTTRLSLISGYYLTTVSIQYHT
ncbi:hypothetical protein BDF21DRAFT_395115 [Thamnidium elegans]|nr:hypothetical protein BDF21DRAFT_395115 [Thamnidium elegans]